MTRHALRFSLLIAAIAATLFSVPWPAAANNGVTFTLIPKSAYTRAQPSLNAIKSFSVFKGLTYLVLAQDPTRTWVQIKIPPTQAGWVPLSYGTVNGDLSTVPVVADSIDPGTPAPEAANSAPPPAQPSAKPSASPAIDIATLKLTLTARSAFARSAPDMAAARIASLFKGQSFTAFMRDATSSWLYIVLPDGRRAWVSAGAGKLSGNILALPTASDDVLHAIEASTPSPTPRATPPETLPAWIPVITSRMQEIYDRAPNRGLDRWMFTVAGDCNSDDYWYRQRLARGEVIPGSEYTLSLVGYIRNALWRKSLAARGSFTAASMFNPVWADRTVCRKGEGPLTCELRLTRASVVFIGLGTGDHLPGQWNSFEANYRPVIEYTLKTGALPVLVTKGDDLEMLEGGAPSGYLNNIVRRLGQEYEVPVFDLALGLKTLPNSGLAEEPGNDFHLSFPGLSLRNLGILQIMYLLAGKNL